MTLAVADPGVKPRVPISLTIGPHTCILYTLVYCCPSSSAHLYAYLPPGWRGCPGLPPVVWCTDRCLSPTLQGAVRSSVLGGQGCPRDGCHVSPPPPTDCRTRARHSAESARNNNIGSRKKTNNFRPLNVVSSSPISVYLRLFPPPGNRLGRGGRHYTHHWYII